jgi:hypothetical protein
MGFHFCASNVIMRVFQAQPLLAKSVLHDVVHKCRLFFKTLPLVNFQDGVLGEFDRALLSVLSRMPLRSTSGLTQVYREVPSLPELLVELFSFTKPPAAISALT